jgi:hypothetical protein
LHGPSLIPFVCKIPQILSKQWHDLVDELLHSNKKDVGTIFLKSGRSRPFEPLAQTFGKEAAFSRKKSVILS